MAIKIMKMNEEEYKKIFVVTDIHGRYDLFKRLLEELNFTKEDLLGRVLKLKIGNIFNNYESIY